VFYGAWDQQIAYTWGPGGRWIMPAQYYALKVNYPSKNFAVDYFVIDTNVGDAGGPVGLNNHDALFVNHNTCNSWYNNYDCSPLGPKNPAECVDWFNKLWDAQVQWLEKKLDESVADWQIVVTHFPPEDNVENPGFVDDVQRLGWEYGIDIIVAGHRHIQAIYETGFNYWSRTAAIPFVITGGGGGITSEVSPGISGGDLAESAYGFMDMKLDKHMIEIVSYNHWGVYRRAAKFWPRLRSKPERKLNATGEQIV